MQKWGKNHHEEVFFYNPHQFYQEFKDFDSLYLHVWNNGILCNSYKGGIWIVSDIEYHKEEEGIFSISGMSKQIPTANIWNITIYQAGALNGKRTYRLRINPDETNNITKWLHNLTL
jgi:hypothetical protein